MKPKLVTLWYKDEMILDTEADDFEGFLHSGEWKFVFNHLEDKIVPLYQEKPEPIKPEFKKQYEWKNRTWAKQLGIIKKNGVVVPITYLATINEDGKVERV